MSKEEMLKVKTCVLKVNIHCDGCKRKVMKTLQKIEGVYKCNIDSELGKVTVCGTVDPATLVKKLGKSGKHAELWGAPKALNNQFKSMQIENSKGGNNKKGQKGGNNNPKGAQNTLLHQQLPKAFQDLKLPQFKGLKLPFGKDSQGGGGQKAVKFNLPEEDDLSDYDYDEFDDDDDEFGDDDDLDDEMDDAPHLPHSKMKPMMGSAQMMPNMMQMMNNGQQHPQLMNLQGKGGGGSNNGGNGKKVGGGGNIPVHVNDGKNGKKSGGGGGGNNNQNQGGKNGGKNPNCNTVGGGGAQGKAGNNSHSGGGGNNNHGNGGKKGGASGGLNDAIQGLPNMSGAYHGMGGGGGGGGYGVGQMGQMGNFSMGQMSQMPAVQGLPMNAASGGSGGGYFAGAGPEITAGNPYHQQQLAAMMMNQQRTNGNERFQPMMYARQPPAVNYMPPYPYPYHVPPPDPYTSAFSDENPSSCSLM